MKWFGRAISTLIICLVFSAVAHAADWEGVFQGTLGKSRIIVQLVEPVDDAEGDTRRDASRYSYLPKVRDINLILTSGTGELRFDETLLQPYLFNDEGTPDKKVTGRWALRIKGDAGKGTWTSADGKKKLGIVLSRVPAISDAERGPDRNLEIATYDELWAKSLTFADAGPARTFGPVEVRLAKDSAFGIVYPVLGAFPNATLKAKANAALLAAAHKSVVQFRECKNSVPVDWEEANPLPEFSSTVVYASPTVLSFIESGSVFCGGAHPSNYITPITYDLATGTQMGGRYLLDLSPEGFGRVLKLANKEERAAFEAFAMERWMKAAAADTEMGGDCSQGWMTESPAGEREFSLSFTDTGLAVRRTDFPHVSSVCLETDFNPTIIPWAELKPWLKHGQTLLSNEIK